MQERLEVLPWHARKRAPGAAHVDHQEDTGGPGHHHRHQLNAPTATWAQQIAERPSCERRLRPLRLRSRRAFARQGQHSGHHALDKICVIAIDRAAQGVPCRSPGTLEVELRVDDPALGQRQRRAPAEDVQVGAAGPSIDIPAVPLVRRIDPQADLRWALAVAPSIDRGRAGKRAPESERQHRAKVCALDEFATQLQSPGSRSHQQPRRGGPIEQQHQGRREGARVAERHLLGERVCHRYADMCRVADQLDVRGEEQLDGFSCGPGATLDFPREARPAPHRWRHDLGFPVIAGEHRAGRQVVGVRVRWIKEARTEPEAVDQLAEVQLRAAFEDLVLMLESDQFARRRARPRPLPVQRLRKGIAGPQRRGRPFAARMRRIPRRGWPINATTQANRIGHQPQRTMARIRQRSAKGGYRAPEVANSYGREVQRSRSRIGAVNDRR